MFLPQFYKMFGLSFTRANKDDLKYQEINTFKE